MAIEVIVQVRDLTAEEDATLVEALDLEGSPPSGGRIIGMAGPQRGGRHMRGMWDSVIECSPERASGSFDHATARGARRRSGPTLAAGRTRS